MESDVAGMTFGLLGIGMFFVLGLFVLALIAFWIWMLVDCIQHEFSPEEANAKVVWILVIVLVGWLGALIYFFVVKKGKPRNLPSP